MIVFVHIHRTAGSSIHASFADHFPDRWLVASGNGDLEHFAQVVAASDDRNFYIGGHVGLHDLAEWGISVAPSDIRFSVLRDPLERAASLFCLLRRSPDWFPHITPHVENKDFPYFYEFCRDHGYHFLNDSCRLLSNSQNYENAEKAIVETMDIVGFTTQMPLFEKALAELLSPVLPHFHILEEKQNVALQAGITSSVRDVRSSVEEIIGKAFIERVMVDNESDARLVNFVACKHEGVFVNKHRRDGVAGCQVRGQE